MENLIPPVHEVYWRFCAPSNLGDFHGFSWFFMVPRTASHSRACARGPFGIRVCVAVSRFPTTSPTQSLTPTARSNPMPSPGLRARVRVDRPRSLAQPRTPAGRSTEVPTLKKFVFLRKKNVWFGALSCRITFFASFRRKTNFAIFSIPQIFY